MMKTQTTAAIMKAVLMSVALAILSTPAHAESVATMRNDKPISAADTPLVMYRINNEDIKRKRSYPMQPPLIPHHVRDYQIDLYANKCLYCHARSRSETSQAPMISVTHYMNRDGNFLANVSPRRYFCLQCHVAQTDARPIVENDFVDIDQILNAVLPEAESQ